MVRVCLQEEGPCVHFISLPPYSPQRNPIERLWKWRKDTVIANVLSQRSKRYHSSHCPVGGLHPRKC
ncbi:transposase [Geobacillus sp. FSL W8-0032]|nr:transposase [Geobacillus icigianus]